jgi:hypothetical protein
MREMVSRRLTEGQSFLDFDHLLQAALPRAIGHHPAGVLIDDLQLAVDNQVVPVELEQVHTPTGPARRVPRAPAECATVPAARGELGNR